MDQPELLRTAFPSYGPDWDAAIDYGIDVSLLLRNLELTPSQRLEQHQEMLDLMAAMAPKNDGDEDPAKP